MKKILPILMLMFASSSGAYANGLHHRLTSSVQLTTNAAASQAIRIGNSYSVSGSGVNTAVGDNSGQIGSLAAHSSGTAANPVVTATQATNGSAFSFAQSYTAGDAVGSAITIGSNPVFGDITTTGVGTGTGTGTITSAHAITAVGGGSGTSTIGQFVSELTLN
tara:strand:+ start:359 stop:850 length:492 start_codon:yes stop_codon:yes gene_type:complete